MHNLDYEYHLDYYKKLYAQSKEKTNENFIQQQAQARHALTVLNSLRDTISVAIDIASKLKHPEAICFMQYGVCRRLLMTLFSYKAIALVADAERTNPLSFEEGQELTKEVNLIYLNIRGILDNLVSCYLLEKEENLYNKLKPIQISLFGKEVQKKSENLSFWNKLTEYKEWEKELKEKRDPVAHRIPLYIIPSMVDEAEVDEYKQLDSESIQALQKMDFSKAKDCYTKMESMGKFIPCFAHHPENYYPIYPTVPNDLGNVIKILKVVQEELLKDFQ